MKWDGAAVVAAHRASAGAPHESPDDLTLVKHGRSMGQPLQRLPAKP